MTSRRHFLRAAAALGAGALLRPLLGRAATNAALPLPADSLRVVFLTDIHTRDDLPGIPPYLDSLAARINALQPNLILSGGDSIEGGFNLNQEQTLARWAIYRSFQQKLSAPVYSVAGNHDILGAYAYLPGTAPTDPFAMFRQQFHLTRNYGSFNAAGWHFILLDSVDVQPNYSAYRGYVDDAQLAWLRNDLAGVSSQTPIVLLTHIPLQSPLPPYLQARLAKMCSSLVVENSAEVLAAFAGKNLRLVLQGHLHVDAAPSSAAPQFITGGAVCGQWWQGSNLGTPNGFGLLALDPQNSGWQYFDCPWTLNSPQSSPDPHATFAL
jgi:3',5'-cyclic AMP phosphodiesterase CpdA